MINLKSFVVLASKEMIDQTTRYQAAIMRDHHILLIKQLEHASGRSYWLLPGGRMEAGETEQACVRREAFEETGLQVEVDRLLLDEQNILGRSYGRRKTFLCSTLAGEAQPGYEPEAAYASAYTFIEVGWFDLRQPDDWGEQFAQNPIAYDLLQQLQVILGYETADENAKQ